LNNFTPLTEPIPISDQNWPEGTLPLVTTRTMTFNHEAYIGECIEGILKQKTTFPVQVLIHDDASTDNSIQILKEYESKYPGVLTVYYQGKNTYSSPHKHEMREGFFDLIKGKYIALCEGDDYWIDPMKLQKQVSFLESNLEYGVVFTDFDQFFQTSNNFIHSYHKTFKTKIPTGYVFRELLYNNLYVTCTSLYRTETLKNYNYDFKKEKISTRDICVWLHIAATWKVGYINESTSVYRVLEKSASHSLNIEKDIEFRKSGYKISEFYANYYSIKFDKRKKEKEISKSIIKNILHKKKYRLLINYWKYPSLILMAFVREIVIKIFSFLFNK